MENVRTTKRIFIENWIEELKPVVKINKRGRDEFVMKEFELVVAEQYKFENGAKWKKVALLGNFGLSRHWWKVNNSKVL